MNTINAASASGLSTLSPLSTTQSFAVSPDAILAYCSASLNDLDSQLSEKMAAQENNNTLAKQWSDVESIIAPYAANGIQTDCGGAVANYQQTATALIQEYQAVKQSSGNADLMNEIGALFTSITGGDIQHHLSGGAYTGACSPPTAVAPEDFDTTIMQPIKNGESQVSQGSDLAMVEIQSLVSQRQQAVQLSTQIMSAVDQTLLAPINNTGKDG